METLLCVCFDHLSSHDGIKIRRGLRQLEGLLAQLCLNRPQMVSSKREQRKSDISGGSQGITQDLSEKSLRGKELSHLQDDPAFCEYFKLQEGFEYNVAIRLIQTLERLLSRSTSGTNDLLTVSALDLLQGALLVHPPSRALFARTIHMNLLLDLLDPVSCPAVQSSTMLVLVTALLERPANTRCFERLDGLLAVTSLIKNSATTREVKMRIVEFFYFYLMPENTESGASLSMNKTKSAKSVSENGMLGLHGRKLTESGIRTTEEKQIQLGRHLHNVEDLVEDLRNSSFGVLVP